MKSHIKEIRETKGLTQMQVANQAQIGVRSYQRYEAGIRLPGIPAALRIASVLNCTVEELFPVYGCEDAKTKAMDSEQSPNTIITQIVSKP